MSGKLYGLGIGPGDPELITLKAKRLLEEADIIFFPGSIPEDTVAYKIVTGAVDTSKKELVGIPFPMTKDRKVLAENHRAGASKIEEYLNKGKTAVFPTLGDTTMYATYMYVHKLVAADGYDTEIVPGVPSFCAAAAKLNDSLVERNEELHVIPSSYGVTEALHLSGTKVFMKAGSKFKEVLAEAKQSGQHICVLENVGMENERIYKDPGDDIEAGYYTLIIVKETE